MVTPDAAKAALLDPYVQLLRRSSPFGDVVLPGQAASHLMHVTDLVWILHILGGLDLTVAERDSWAARINRDQDPQTGMFHYPPGESHINAHATWQCVAALNMLGRRPRHRLACLEPLLTAEGYRTWCDAYDPATSHHRFFLGVLAAASAPVGDAWKAAFGDWFARHQDPATGFPFHADSPHRLSPAFLLTTKCFLLCGAVPWPGRIVETVLAFQAAHGGFTGDDLPGYMDMDAAFLLHLLGPSVPHAGSRIETALVRLSGFVETVLADGPRHERLLARPHQALSVCGALSVLWRHLEGRATPFPWAELHHYRVDM